MIEVVVVVVAAACRYKLNSGGQIQNSDEYDDRNMQRLHSNHSTDDCQMQQLQLRLRQLLQPQWHH